MKIAMLGHKAVPSRLGGIEIHVEDLGERLAKKGHEVHIYNRSVYDTGLKEYKGMKMHSSFTVKKNSLEAVIYSFIASLKVAFSHYDIVHYHALGPTVMSFIPRIMGKKVVCTVHGLDWQRAKWKGFATNYLKFGEYASAKFVNATISVSKPLVSYYKQKYDKHVEFIPNGINHKELKSLEDLQEIYDIKPQKYLLFVARLVPEKGCHYLIEAFKQVDTDFKLIIAGDSPYNKDYIQELKNLAKEDKKIKMIGFQEFDVLERLYSNTYAYVLPSDIEGMPLSLLEAMNYGAFCLVSNIAENMAVIGDMGVSFEQGNINSLKERLETILKPDFKEKMGFEAYMVRDYMKKNFDWDVITDKTEELYYRVAKN